MSDLLNRYLASTKLRPAQAKVIPGNPVNMFDIQNTFAKGYTPGQVQGNPTLLTDRAMAYYDEELSGMVVPSSFVRHDVDIPLNRWNPNTRYYVPGGAPGETPLGEGNR